MGIAATNRPDMIDPALVRSGRFDRLVMVEEPGLEDRKEIFRIHTQDMPLASEVGLTELAEITEGYVGSDIASIAREAAIEALREDSDSTEVEMRHFRKALDSVRPTMTADLLKYYHTIQDEFKGSTGLPTSAQRNRIGFQ